MKRPKILLFSAFLTQIPTNTFTKEVFFQLYSNHFNCVAEQTLFLASILKLKLLTQSKNFVFLTVQKIKVKDKRLILLSNESTSNFRIGTCRQKHCLYQTYPHRILMSFFDYDNCCILTYLSGGISSNNDSL